MLIYRQVGKQANKQVCVFIYMQFIITMLYCIYIFLKYLQYYIHVTYFYIFIHKRIYVVLCLNMSKSVMLKIFCSPSCCPL